MSREIIPGGAFTVARCLFNHELWHKEPLYLKIWIWILGRASHTEHEKNGYRYARGEFVTTYSDIRKVVMHEYNRQPIVPSLKKIRIILEWLKHRQMIRVIPLKSVEIQTGAHPKAQIGAYIGIRIIVVNYDTYQNHENYRGRLKGRVTDEQGPDNNNGNKNGKIENQDIDADIVALKERYRRPDLIDLAIAAFASTRKSNRISASVVLKQLLKWDSYPVEQVEGAIRIYLKKGCASEGKGEKYLLGIIRNQQPQAMAKTHPEWH